MLTRDESRQIEVLRVFCVTMMMWVHVSPGLSHPSIVSTGEYHALGTLLGGTLGRISVTVLSFVSGYLVWSRASAARLQDLVARRLQTIILPMLVWSAIYLTLAGLHKDWSGVPQSARLSLWSVFNDWSGFAGPTRNLSLFFLRDLFVATLILRIAAPLIRSAPLIAGLFALAVGMDGDLLAPVIFRSSILQFMLLGAVAARCGCSVTSLSRPLIAIPAGYLALVVSIVVLGRPELRHLLLLDVPEFLRRLGIGLLLMALSAAFLGVFPRSRLPRLGRHAFLAYLMHVPFIAILWAAWQTFGGSEAARSYALFYVAAPLVTFAAAVWLGRALDRAPDGFQRLLRGRARSDTSDRSLD